jgi:hypothetical protein
MAGPAVTPATAASEAPPRDSFDLDALTAGAIDALRGLLAREDVRFVLHVLLLMATLTIARPLFAAPVPAQSYESTSIFWDLVGRDLNTLIDAARRQHPAAPRILFLLVPTAAFFLTGERPTWQRFESGRALRTLILTLLFLLAWTGATFDYNLYLDRGHGFDRLLLVALFAASWATPIAVPFATAWVYVMMKEAYLPISLDDFDFRSVFDVLVVFSCFVWLSIKKSYQTRHFLWVALGAWASYYFCAGVAKLGVGPKWSWLLENDLSNIAVGGYVRGWLSFLPESWFVGFANVARKTDRGLAFFTIIVELGALAMFHLHARTSRLWMLFAALLNFGIFAMCGICFWKWIGGNLAFYWFSSRGGAAVLKEATRHKLGILLAVVAIWYGKERSYFFPQTHVVWYDTALSEDYRLVAIGANTGERYTIDPGSITPMEMHWVQGRLGYAADSEINEKCLVGIYGNTGGFPTFTALQNAKTPEEGLRMVHHGHPCNDPEKQKTFDEFMKRFFGRMNRYGKRPWRWLHAIKGPTHLWVFARGNVYKQQEPIAKIELWREVVFRQGGSLHHLEDKKLHEVEIPRR